MIKNSINKKKSLLFSILIIMQIIGSILGTYIFEKTHNKINIFSNHEFFYIKFKENILPNLLINIPITCIIILTLKQLNKK